MLDLVEVGGDGRGGGELDQGLEQVERVVVPAAGVLGVVGAAVELRQRQREPSQVVTSEFVGHSSVSFRPRVGTSRPPSTSLRPRDELSKSCARLPLSQAYRKWVENRVQQKVLMRHPDFMILSPGEVAGCARPNEIRRVRRHRSVRRANPAGAAGPTPPGSGGG